MNSIVLCISSLVIRPPKGEDELSSSIDRLAFEVRVRRLSLLRWRVRTIPDNSRDTGIVKTTNDENQLSIRSIKSPFFNKPSIKTAQ